LLNRLKAEKAFDILNYILAVLDSTAFVKAGKQTRYIRNAGSKGVIDPAR
jgi:hypothetical protein